MVAVVSGNGLGLLNGSLSQLGLVSGAAALGQGRDQQYVNTTNGNLVIQGADAALVFNGVSLSDLRTYNSEGTGSDQGWLWGFSQKTLGLTGTVNTAGSTIKREAQDGSVLTYTYDATSATYKASGEAGARDSLSWNATTSRWTWTDSESRRTETYNASGALTAVADPLTGGSYTLAYANGRLTTVTAADGDVLTFGYDAQGRVTSLSTTEVPAGGTTAVTRTAVAYGYDAQGRLSTITTSLDSDSKGSTGSFTSTYTYDGTSNRIASLTQGDGTTVAYAYTQGADGTYRVTRITTGAGSDASVQSIDYASVVEQGVTLTSTTITDADGRGWTYKSDANGRLVQVVSPAVNGQRQTAAYTYDSNNNVTTVSDALGNKSTYTYDASGNRITEQDQLGNSITRTFSATNRLLTETTYRTATPGAAPTTSSTPETVRYVYENDRLRFTIDAKGDVVENQYDAAGKLTMTRQFTGAKYSITSLALTATPTLAQMNTWAKARDLTLTRRTDYTYDLRGLLATSQEYSTVNSAGAGVSDAGTSTTRYLFDAMGQLRQSAVVRGTGTDTTTYAYDGMGRLIGSVSANGASTTWSYGADGSVTQVTVDPTGAAGSLVHTEFRNSRGDLVAVRDGDASASQTRTTTNVYDAAGDLRATVHPDGGVDYNFYDAAGRLAMTVDAAGDTTEFVRDLDGRVISTTRYATPVSTSSWLVQGAVVPASAAAVRPATNALDEKTSVTYDAAGRIATSTDASGLVTTNTYDGESNLVKTVTGTGTNALTTRYFYDAAGNLQATLDPDGYLTERVVDETGKLTQLIRYSTATTASKRATGTLATLRPAGAWDDQTTLYYYDAQGRTIGALDGESYFTRYTYDETSRTTTTIRYAAKLDDRADSTWATLVSLTAGTASQTTSSRQDGDGNVVSVIDAQGTETRSSYDAFDRLVSTVQAFGITDQRTQSASYDVFGDVVTTMDGQGNVTHYTFDAAGRQTSRTDALGQTSWTVYDALGRVRYTVQGEANASGTLNAAGDVVAYTYDAFGDVTSRTAYASRIAVASTGPGVISDIATAVAAVASAAKDGAVHNTYDAAGRLSQSVNALGLLTSYAYTANGQLASTTLQLGGGKTTVTNYAYDKRGNLLSAVEDAGGLARTTSRTYDAFGRVATETDGLGAVTVHEYDDINRENGTLRTIDGDSREIIRQFDAYGRVLSVADPAGNVTTYAYSDTDRTQTTTTPEGVVTTVKLNREGQTLSIANASGTLAAYSYDGNGELLTSVGPNGLNAANQYDAVGRLVSTADGDGRTVTYSYDAAGRVLVRTVDPAGLALTTRYTYDARGQEVAVVDAAGWTTVFAYDANGDMTSRTVDPSGVANSTAFTYDNQGRQLTVTSGAGTSAASTTRFVYDNLGRVKQRIVGDQLQLTTSFGYDADDHVISSTDPMGATTYFAYDEAGQLIFQVDPAGAKGGSLGTITRFTYDVAGDLVSSLTTGSLVSTTSLAGQAGSSTESMRSAMLALLDASSNASDTASYKVMDGDGRVRYTVDADGGVVEYRYNNLGQLSAQLAYHGVITPSGDLAIALRDGTATVDDVQQALTEFNQSASTASQVQFFYDGAGRVVFTVTVESSSGTAVGIVAETQYDSAGNAVSSIAHLKTLTSAQLASVLDTATIASAMASDRLAVVTQRVFDAANRQVAVRDPDRGVSYTFYDGDGRVTGTVDATGALVEYTYDSGGKVTVRKAYGGTVDTSSWLQQGKMTVALADVVETDDGANWIETHFSYDALERVVSKTSYNNDGPQVTVYTYDGASRLTSSTATSTAGLFSESRTTTNYYDADGRLVATRDPMNYVRETVYDAAGLATSTIAYASAVALSYDANGNVLPLSGNFADIRPAASAADEVTHTFYDSFGRMTGSVDAGGYYTELTRDPVGQVLSTTRYATRVAAGSEGNQGAIRSALAGSSALTSSASYDAQGRVLTQTDEQGTVTAFVYDDRGHATSTIYAAGTAEARATSNSYDQFGQMYLSTDALGRQTTYAHDAAGRLTHVTDPLGNATWYINDADGRVLYVIRGLADSNGVQNALGEVVENTYDGLGELIETTTYGHTILISSLSDYTPSTVASVVNAIASPYTNDINVTNAWDHTVTYRYDNMGDLTQVRSGFDVLKVYGYNGFGELNYTFEAGGTPLSSGCGYAQESADVTYYKYDADGHRIGAYAGVSDYYDTYLIKSQKPADFFDSEYWTVDSGTAYQGRAALVTLSDFDAFGNVIRTTDGRGVVKEFTYDQRNQQISSTAVMSVGPATSTVAYDAFRRIASTTDALGHTTTFAYDEGQRTMVVRSPEGVTMTTSYNRAGQVIAVRDAAGHGTVYQYDATGKLSSTTDAVGGSTMSTYDADGHVIDQVDASGRRVHYSYDATGRVLSRTVDPDGLNLVTKYAYDGAGRMVMQTDPTGSVTAYGYDAAGNQAVVIVDYGDQTHGNVTTWYAYDQAGLVVSVTPDAQYNTPMRRYGYDSMGRLTQVSERFDIVKTYAYDQSGNLSYETDGVGNAIAHIYDDANREIFTLTYTEIGGPSMMAVTQRSFDDDGRLTQLIQYDESYSLSYPDALQAVNPSDGSWSQRVSDYMNSYQRGLQGTNEDSRIINYSYDSDGRQVLMTDGSTITETRYDDLGRVSETLVYLDTPPVTTDPFPPTGPITSASRGVAAPGAPDQAARRTLNYYDDAGRLRFSVKLGPQGGYVTEMTYTASGDVASTRLYSQPIPLSSAGDASTTASIASLVSGKTYEGTQDFYDGAGRKVYEINAAGAVTAWKYDGAGRLTWTLTGANPLRIVGSATTATVAAAMARANPLPGDLTGSGSAYDGAGRLVATFDAYGSQPSATYTYNAFYNKVASKTDADGTVHTYSYNSHGNLEVESTIGVAVAAFDGQGRLVSDVETVSTYYYYDNDDRITTRIQGANTPGAVQTNYEYDYAGRVIRTEVLGGTPGTPTSVDIDTRTTYDHAGNRVLDVDANGNSTYHFYDNAGRHVYDLDPDGYVTRYTYNVYGDVVSTTRYAQPVATGDFYLSETNHLFTSLLTSKLVPSDADRTLLVSFDLYGNQTQVTQPAVSYTRPDGSVATGTPTTRYTYDAAGRVTSTSVLVDGTPDVNATWSVSYNFYDVAGNKSATIDALGYMTSWTYDSAGRVLTEVQSARPVNPGSVAVGGAAPARPAAGDASTGLDRVITYTYNALGKVATETTLHSVSNGSGGTVQQQSVVSYGYDGMGRITTLTTNGRTVTTTYDAAGNVATVTGPQERVLVPDWQARLAADATLNLGSDALYMNSAESMSYGYDSLGNRTVETHTNTGTGATVSTYSQFDGAGRLVRTLAPADGHTVDWTSSRVQSYTWGADGTQLSNSYTLTDNTGKAVSIVITNTYDLEGRQLTTTTTRDGVAIADTSHVTTYDAFGETTGSGVSTSADTLAEFDAAGRLTRGTDAKTGIVHTYTYDLAGRVLTDTYPAADGTTLTLTYVHDLDGRVTSQTVATANGLATASNTYDRWGDVLSGTDAKGNVTIYQYDESGHVLSETGASVEIVAADGTAQTTTPVTRSFYDLDGHVVATLDANGVSTHTTYDVMGRVTSVQDGTGSVHTYAYDALGNQVLEQDGLGNLTFRNVDVLGQVVQQGDYTVTNGTRSAVWRQAYVLDEAGNRLRVYDGTGSAFLQAGDQASADLHANWYGYDSQGRVLWSQDPAQRAASLVPIDAPAGDVVVTLPTGSFTMQPTNSDFEQGAAGWGAGGSWSIVKGYDYKSGADNNDSSTGWAGRLDNTDGNYQEMLNSDRVPVVAGMTITAHIEVQQGASKSGHAGVSVRIVWLDANGNRISDTTGEVVDSGDGGEWNQASVTSTAPPGAAYAQFAVTGFNESNDPLFVDAADWDYQYPGVLPGPVVQTTYVYDAAGNRTSMTTADGDTQTWAYDAYGHVTAHTDLSGAQYQYTYDPNTQQLVSSSDNWAGQSGTVPLWVTGAINTPNSETQTYYANGAIKTTTYADGSVYSYQYDANGNVTREESTTLDATNVTIHVVTETTYDSHNRISHVVTTNLASGAQLLDLTYRYDGVGNRREIKGTSGSNTQDAWYTYDGDNRVLVSAGHLTGNAILVTNNAYSYALTYDAVGNATTRTTMSGTHVMVQASRYDSRGQLIEADYSVDTTTGGAYRGLEEKRTYDENGKQVSLIQYYALGTTVTGRQSGKLDPDGEPYERPGVDVGGRLANATFDSYDAFGRLLEEQNFGRSTNWSGAADTVQPPAGQPAGDATSYGGLTLQSATSYVGPNGSAGYDAVGNIVYYQMRTGTSRIDQYTITYLRKDDYLESENSGTNISGTANVVPGADQSIYDRRGNRVGIVQHIRYAGGSTVADTLRAFAYDGHGQIISRRDATDKNGVFDQGTSPASQNQHYMYVAGNQVGHTDEAGKLDILTQVTAFSSGPTNGYVVQVGDTLKSIAQAVYGNASLWYVIAQANAIDSDDGLAVGMDLTIPEVKTSQNDSTTFKPYNASEIAGSTTPTLPTIAPPLPPPSRAHCNVVAAIIVIAVVVVATVFTAGIAAGALASEAFATGASVLAGTSGLALGAAVGAAAVGGLVGNAAGQLVGDALGTHQGFSFGEAVTAGLTSAVTAGVGTEIQTSDSLSLLQGTHAGYSVGGAAVLGATNYGAQSVAASVTGQPNHFSWSGLIASATANALSAQVGLNSQQQQASGVAGASFARNVAGGVFSGAVQRETSIALGDNHVASWASIGETAVGTALGDSLGMAIRGDVAASGSTATADAWARAAGGVNPYSDLAQPQWVGTGIGPVDVSDATLASTMPGTLNSAIAFAEAGRVGGDALDVLTSKNTQVLQYYRSGFISVEGRSASAAAVEAVRATGHSGTYDELTYQRSEATINGVLGTSAVQVPNDGIPLLGNIAVTANADAFDAGAATIATRMVAQNAASSLTGNARGRAATGAATVTSSSSTTRGDGYNPVLAAGAYAAGAVLGLAKAGGETALGVLAFGRTLGAGVAEDLVGTGGISDQLFGLHTTTFDGSSAKVDGVLDAALQFAQHPIDGIEQHVQGLNAQLSDAINLGNEPTYTAQFNSGAGVGQGAFTLGSDLTLAGGGVRAAARFGDAALSASSRAAGVAALATDTQAGLFGSGPDLVARVDAAVAQSGRGIGFDGAGVAEGVVSAPVVRDTVPNTTAATATGSTGSGNSGTYFFDQQVLPYIDREGATLGQKGMAQFFMPAGDSTVVTDAASAYRYSGGAPSLERAYLTGGDVYGVEFPLDGMSPRLPTAADTTLEHFLEGGNTALKLPNNGGYLINQTREFVVPGGQNMPSGSVLFKIAPDGSRVPIRSW